MEKEVVIVALKKCMIGFDEELLAEIEAYAAKMHINRTAAVTVLCSTALQAQKAMTTLEDFMQAYKTEKAVLGLKESEGGAAAPPM